MKTVIVSVIALCFSLAALAQDTKPTVTKEELTKYATVMDSISELSASAQVELAELVKSDSSVSVARYNELSKIIDDPAKLSEAKATPQEIEFVKKISSAKDAKTQQINATYQSLAKDYVTVPVFNKVKKALASDPTLKTRYDSLMFVLAKDNPSIQQ